MYMANVNHSEIDACSHRSEMCSNSTDSEKNIKPLMRQYQLYRHNFADNFSLPRKRRMTISGYGESKHNVINKYSKIRKRRRINSIAFPTKFLLGGNITDPLNLKSLENEDSQHLTDFSAPSSPLPLSQHRTQVKVLIPPNIYDPLNLNTGEEILFKVIASKSRKRKRRRRNSTKNDDVECVNSVQPCPSVSNVSEHLPIFAASSDVKNVAAVNTKEKKVGHNVSQWVESKPKNDKIVSPVVPQGNRKFFRRFSSKSISRKNDMSEQKNEKKSQKLSQKEPKIEKIFQSGCYPSCYGSYPQYKSLDYQDARFKFFDKSIFAAKNVLDIGCNVGFVSVYIAKHLEAKHVTGVDIDSYVINIARKNLLKHWQSLCLRSEEFPTSMNLCYGPISRLPFVDSDLTSFPHNITFVQGNYVLSSEEELQMQQHEYDVIVCLRVSKWIHLNWGDEGLKRSFKRIFTQLRYGGQFIFEPQPWSSYARLKKYSATINNNYNNIKLKPENFIEYLMSEDVGFTTCSILARNVKSSKGVKQPLYLLTKGFPSNDDVQQPATISPVVYNDAEWADRVVEEQDSCCDWEYTVISADNSSSDCALQTGNNENSHYDVFLDDYNFFPEYDDSHGTLD